jgi:hypothetical protein
MPLQEIMLFALIGGCRASTICALCDATGGYASLEAITLTMCAAAGRIPLAVNASSRNGCGSVLK